MLTDFFKIAANLKNIPRQGWIEKLKIENPESVADHTFSTTIISLIYSDLQKLDTAKVLKMSLLHDLAESVVGDITPSMRDYNNKIDLETKTFKKIIKNLPNNLQKEYLQIWNEYVQNKSKEAQLVHDADRLELALQANIYEKNGFKKARLLSFYNTADRDIKSARLRKILSELS